MTKEMLLPNWFKKIGWVIFIPAAILGLLICVSDFSLGDSLSETASRIMNNAALTGIIAGSFLVTCSRERIEDEMVGRIRLNALLSALYVNYALVIIAALVFYELRFLEVMIYNLATLPVLFLAIYEVCLWRFKHSAQDEE